MENGSSFIAPPIKALVEEAKEDEEAKELLSSDEDENFMEMVTDEAYGLGQQNHPCLKYNHRMIPNKNETKLLDW